MAYEGEDNRVEAKDLLIVAQKDPEAGEKYNKEGSVIRIVQWLFEGKGKNKGTVQGSVSLEKRAIFLNEDGEVRNGKAKGFTLEDMAVIGPRWKEIVETMKNAPSPAWPASSAKPKPQAAEVPDGIEEVPF